MSEFAQPSPQDIQAVAKKAAERYNGEKKYDIALKDITAQINALLKEKGTWKKKHLKDIEITLNNVIPCIDPISAAQQKIKAEPPGMEYE